MMELFRIRHVCNHNYCWKAILLLLLFTSIQEIRSEESNRELKFNGTTEAPETPNFRIDCGDPVKLYKTVKYCQESLQMLTSSGYPWIRIPINSRFVSKGNRIRNYQYVAVNNSRFGDPLDSLKHVCDVYQWSRRCLQYSDVRDACLLVADQSSLGLQVTFDFICTQQYDENLINTLGCLYRKRVLSMLPFQIMQRCGLGVLDDIARSQNKIMYYILENVDISNTQMLMHSMLHLYC